MKLLMAVKRVGAAAVKGFVFSYTLQRRLCESKNHPELFDFHSDGSLQTPTADRWFLTGLDGFLLAIWWHFLDVATNG